MSPSSLASSGSFINVTAQTASPPISMATLTQTVSSLVHPTSASISTMNATTTAWAGVWAGRILVQASYPHSPSPRARIAMEARVSHMRIITPAPRLLLPRCPNTRVSPLAILPPYSTRTRLAFPRDPRHPALRRVGWEEVEAACQPRSVRSARINSASSTLTRGALTSLTAPAVSSSTRMQALARSHLRMIVGMPVPVPVPVPRDSHFLYLIRVFLP